MSETLRSAQSAKAPLIAISITTMCEPDERTSTLGALPEKLAPVNDPSALMARSQVLFLQGVLVRRPSRIFVKATLAAGDVTGVKVGGSAVQVGEGSVRF